MRRNLRENNSVLPENSVLRLPLPVCPLLSTPAGSCFEVLPRFLPSSPFPLLQPSGPITLGSPCFQPYPRPLLDLQGLPRRGRLRPTLHLLFKALQSRRHLIYAAPPSATSQLRLLPLPWVSAVPVPAGPLLPSPTLMPSSSSSLGLSFPLWAEPHRCLPFQLTSSRKPSIWLVARVDFSWSLGPHSTAHHRFYLFMVLYLFHMFVQFPSLQKGRIACGRAWDLSFWWPYSAFLKEVVSAQETCSEVEINWGPNLGYVQSLLCQWSYAVLCSSTP